jgi:large subunit ribosomal protein L19e
MTFDLGTQKRLAGAVMKVAPKRVRFDPTRLNDIKAAITKVDVGSLIKEGAITAIQKQGVSRGRAKHIAKQKAKGLRQGPGSRKGKATARAPAKDEWMSRIRAQRDFLRELKQKEIITLGTYRNLYMKSKGGFFRSLRHIKIYMNDQGLVTRPAKK